MKLYRRMPNLEKIRYKKLINKLIKSSFPILESKNIHVMIVHKSLSSFLKFSAMADWEIYLWLIIYINPRYNIYNDFELKGLLAHELSHLEDWVVKGRWYTFINSLKCGFSDSYKAKYEKETDKKAICKGYRKELKAQREKRYTIKDKNLNKLKKFYLTPEEIDEFVY